MSAQYNTVTIIMSIIVVCNSADDSTVRRPFSHLYVDLATTYLVVQFIAESPRRHAHAKKGHRVLRVAAKEEKENEAPSMIDPPATD